MSPLGESKSSEVGSEPSASNSTSALHQLLSPDGYYTYLNIPSAHLSNSNANSNANANANVNANATKENATNDGVDTDLVKKNYRRLSLKHHPDRRGGDPETFRVLNRAKKVLTTPKLRKQYDLLGLDLIDEEDDVNHSNDDNGPGASNSDVDGEQSKEDANSNAGSPDSVMSQLASVTLASILQVTVRTALLALVATFVTRFKFTVVPMVLFLAFVSFRVKNTPGTTPKEYMIPILLILGLTLMHFGRSIIPPKSETDAPIMTTSTWLFFFGEMLTINMFIQTSLPPQFQAVTNILNVLTLTASFVIALMLQGRFWRYAMIIGIEAVLALITVLVFPIMEMILEEIMNEKLRKIGEKVRAHAKRLESELKK